MGGSLAPRPLCRSVLEPAMLRGGAGGKRAAIP